MSLVAMKLGEMAQDLAAYSSALPPDHHIRKSNPRATPATDVISTNVSDTIRQLAQSRTLYTLTAIRHRYHRTSPPSRYSFNPCTPFSTRRTPYFMDGTKDDQARGPK